MMSAKISPFTVVFFSSLPCGVVADNEIPAWEIGLAAGSGALALILCIFAIFSFRRSQTRPSDIEQASANPATVKPRTAPPRPSHRSAPARAPHSAARVVPTTTPVRSVQEQEEAPSTMEGIIFGGKQLIENIADSTAKVANVAGLTMKGAKGVATTAKNTTQATAGRVRRALNNPEDEQEREAINIETKVKAAEKNPGQTKQASAPSTSSSATAPKPKQPQPKDRTGPTRPGTGRV